MPDSAIRVGNCIDVGEIRRRALAIKNADNGPGETDDLGYIYDDDIRAIASAVIALTTGGKTASELP